MKSTTDNPVDPLGSLGAPIRPASPPKPDPVREFEHIGDTAKAAQTVSEACGKPVTTGAAEEWHGLDFGAAYIARMLECI